MVCGPVNSCRRLLFVWPQMKECPRGLTSDRSGLLYRVLGCVKSHVMLKCVTVNSRFGRSCLVQFTLMQHDATTLMWFRPLSSLMMRGPTPNLWLVQCLIHLVKVFNTFGRLPVRHLVEHLGLEPKCGTFRLGAQADSCLVLRRGSFVKRFLFSGSLLSGEGC